MCFASQRDRLAVFKVQADHVGYRDQRYSASYDDYGKLKVSFEWNQTPLFYSQDTATLYTSPVSGCLRIDDAIQSGLQNNTTTLANAVGQAQTFDLRQTARHPESQADLQRDAEPRLEPLDQEHDEERAISRGPARSDSATRSSSRCPLDTRTTDLGTALEWANSRGMVRLGYDGSFFRNNISTLVVGQPAQRRPTRRRRGRSQGRMALWPNSDLNAANVTGMLNLPVAEPRDGLPLGRELVAERSADSVHDQQRPPDDPARSDDRRRAGAGHGDDLLVHVEADRSAVVQRPLPFVRFRQPHAGVPRRQHASRMTPRRGVRRRAAPARIRSRAARSTPTRR